MAFYWHFAAIDGGEVYLQLEHEKLCFKVAVTDVARQAELRHHWHERLIKAARDQSIELQRPTRFGRGRWMTVATIKNYIDCNANGVLDLDRTVLMLHDAQLVIDAALNSSA